MRHCSLSMPGTPEGGTSFAGPPTACANSWNIASTSSLDEAGAPGSWLLRLENHLATHRSMPARQRERSTLVTPRTRFRRKRLGAAPSLDGRVGEERQL